MTATRPGLRPPTRPAWHGPPDVLRLLWTRPRASVRWLIDHGGLRLSILLVCGATATTAIADATLISAFERFGAWAWVVDLAVEMLIGVVAWLVCAALLVAVGRVFGGVGSWNELLIALAWGEAPVAAGMPVALLLAWSRSLGSAGSEFLCVAILLGLFAWALVTTSLAVAEAHRFSFARGLLCLAVLAALSTAVFALLWR